MLAHGNNFGECSCQVATAVANRTIGGLTADTKIKVINPRFPRTGLEVSAGCQFLPLSKHF